ncbi:MAG TPA: class I SAM-dependent methyltransferase [Patescibacteria group bacterium]|nr:class I SAM-dependent methyltransferase [Patescibacteria group bacterium]
MTTESWSGGADYESFVGWLSRRVAPVFIDWLAVRPGADWVDVGCGTGALVTTILERAAPVSVVGVDPSEAFLDHARAAIGDSRARFATGAAAAVPLPGAATDAAVAGLVLNFVPDAPAALGELRRIVRRGGTVGAYVWDYADRMEPIRRFFDAAVTVDAGAAEADEGARFPLCRPGPLGDAFAAAGFGDVTVREIEVPAEYPSFERFWAPFLSGVGAAPRYLVGLEPAAQAAIRERLRATLPTQRDGSIHLVARAWAVRGTRRGGAD